MSEVANYREAELEFRKSAFHQFASSVGASDSLKTLTFVGSALPLPHIKGSGELSRVSRMLDLSNQNLNPLSGIIIGALVSQHHTLTEISLHNNVSLGPEGTRAIVDKLCVSTMRTLDLNAVIPVLPVAESKKIEKQGKKFVELCKSVGRLTGLEKLTFDKDSLLDFKEIGILTDLKFLTVNNNKIEVLPENVCYLRSLKRLAAWSNKLLELPPSIGNLEALENLDLKGNRLTYLPSSIGQLAMLKYLDVSENAISRWSSPSATARSFSRLRSNRIRSLGRHSRSRSRASRRSGASSKSSRNQERRRARAVASSCLATARSGKTSLQRGLRYGAPRPAEKDERTVQLDISSFLSVRVRTKRSSLCGTLAVRCITPLYFSLTLLPALSTFYSCRWIL